MLNVEVYIGSEKLDLFRDESVVLNRTVKDFKELDKVFSDYTQTFTIPASKQNNKVMQHWYNESIATGFNPASKKAASIEINKLPFKTGYIWLNSAQLKNDKVDFYEISFFSSIPNLKTIFGKDTLPELGSNLSTTLDYYSFEDAVEDRVGGDSEVLIPLIANTRNWSLDGWKSLSSINADYLIEEATWLQKTLVPSEIIDPNNRFDRAVNCFTQDSGTGSDLFAVTMIVADPTATWMIEFRDERDDYNFVNVTSIETGSASAIVAVNEGIPFHNIAITLQHYPKCEFKLTISVVMGSDTEPTQCIYNYYNNGGLTYELKPAIQAAKVVDAIEAKYGITFSGDFLGTSAFTDLYIPSTREKGFGDHLKMGYTQLQDGTEVIDTNSVWDNSIGLLTIPASSGDVVVSVGANVLQSLFEEVNELMPTPKLRIVCSESLGGGGTALFEEAVLEEGQNGTHQFLFPNDIADRDFKFYVSSNFPELFNWVVNSDDLELLVEKERDVLDENESAEFYFTDHTYADGLTSTDRTIQGGLPAQKVNDFISGIIKMFNLVIIPTSETTFDLKTYDYWMSEGVEINLTKYIKTDEQTVLPASLYNQIRFYYDDTETILGENFRNTYGIGYGNLETEIRDSFGDEISSENFALNVPFQNPSWDRLTNKAPRISEGDVFSDVLVMQNIDNELKPLGGYTMLMYYADQVNLETLGETKYSFRPQHRTKSVAADNHWLYNLCFQYNTDDDSFTSSLNFGSEVNPFTLTDGNSSSPSIYNDYWSNWITDLYDLSMRRTMLKAKLPLHVILSLNMNDVIVIGFKKYTINSMKLEITTGEAEFELLTLVE